MKTLLRFASLATALTLATSPLAAQNFQRAETQAQSQLETSLQELSTLRNQIADEKIPLSRNVTSLEDQVLELRKSFEEQRSIQDAATIDLQKIRDLVKSLEEQQGYLGSLLNEFVRNFEGRLHVSENETYLPATGIAKTAPSNPNLSAEEKMAAQLDVVDLALDRLEQMLGGHRYPGEAVANGDVLEGQFVSYGPTVYFASSDSTVAGIAENQLNADNAAVIDLGSTLTPVVAGTVNSGSGELPLDPTLGKAIKIVQASKKLTDYIEDGGEVGYAIIALGIVSLLIALFKVYEVVGFRAPKTEEVQEVLDLIEEGDLEKANERAAAVPGVSGQMLQVGVAHNGQKRGVVEELLFEKVLGIRPLLERFLPFLAITAATAPLMGLLGTVIGMIKTFNLITIFGTGDAKSLSSGISEALVTTALGLIVAIPVLILHGILSRMAKQKVGVMEQSAVAFVNGLSVLRDKKSED